MPTRGWFVIANENAGSAEHGAVATAVAVLAEHAPVRLAATEHPGEVVGALDEAATSGAMPVVAGGDGSLHLVVGHLHRRGALAATPLGLLPLGTGNDLARAVGLPLDTEAAARHLLTATPRAVDLLVDDTGGVVVNAVHAGLGAVAAERAEGLKDRLGPLAYPAGGLLAGARAGGWKLEVTVDGIRLEPSGDAVLLVGVGNGTTVGGGAPMFPDAVVDDGLLDVVVAADRGAAARAAFGAALRQGTHVDLDDVVTARGREVRITGDEVGYDADGELEDAVAERTYRLEPAAWHLLA